MSQDYQKMWKSLCLDLRAHEELLQALGPAYEQSFMTQRDRPEGMKYFDFVMSEVHGMRIKELMDAKEQGRKVFGGFCVFVPEELILAADGIYVGLCAGASVGNDKAETLLPPNTCALIKGFFGFALEKVCPYLSASDVIVGENTCDGKKKAFEIFKRIVSELYIMDLPQTKSLEGQELLRAEYRKFMEAVERYTGRKITTEALEKAIRTVNAKRMAVQRLARLRASDPAPISGLDGLLVNQVYFYDDPARFTDSVEKLCDELELIIRDGKGVVDKEAKRLLVTGCPMAVPNWKLPMVIEGAGAVVVGEESCVGERGTRNLVDESGGTLEEMLDALVDRYFKIDCAIFTPNPSRYDHVRQMVADYRADGVIQYNLQFCTPYQMESVPIEKALRKEGIPVLTVTTDYAPEDVEQIRTRVEAFLEILS
jgi:benzoyl-CoA reductase/2-hydroxyglutaryl-CoA dehydratase subunit BcrC/BadD/HgdB